MDSPWQRAQWVGWQSLRKPSRPGWLPGESGRTAQKRGDCAPEKGKIYLSAQTWTQCSTSHQAERTEELCTRESVFSLVSKHVDMAAETSVVRNKKFEKGREFL